MVVLPHSRSIVPSATLSKRFSALTGTYLTVRSGRPSFVFTASTIRKHRSTE